MIQEENRPGETGNEGVYWNQDHLLTDKAIINKLVEASQAGVKIENGCQRYLLSDSGDKGYTENIKVISIVGRYLEHSESTVSVQKKEKKYILHLLTL